MGVMDAIRMFSGSGLVPPVPPTWNTGGTAQSRMALGRSTCSTCSTAKNEVETENAVSAGKTGKALNGRLEMSSVPPYQVEQVTLTLVEGVEKDNFAELVELPPEVVESMSPANTPAFEFDDRHACIECRHLAYNGRCLAAGSPAMARESVTSHYRPHTEILRRCDGFEASQGRSTNGNLS